MVGEYFGRCSPASLSLWLPQTKGPALSAAIEQAMKGSLSERHKERKEETWVSGTGLAWLLTFHANFYEIWWWSLCAREHVCVPAALCLTFQSKMKTCRWNKMAEDSNTPKKQCCVVGLLACDGTNTNEAIWPETQVNEESWLKKESRVQDKRPFM